MAAAVELRAQVGSSAAESQLPVAKRSRHVARSAMIVWFGQIYSEVTQDAIVVYLALSVER
jgi:outer membrane protein TolC